jgi:hypothetical protein
MPTPTIVATPGATNANSYLTQAEGQTYFDSRLPVAGWDDGDQVVLLIMATRVLNALARPFRWLVPAQDGVAAHYRTRRQWTGLPASSTQKLAWPRTGMYDGNGNVIASTAIHQDLKEATAELAGQLGNADRTLDNDVQAQGVTSVRAGSVALTFKDMIESKVIPDAVWDLMPPSWFTDELVEPAMPAQFDVVSE